MWEAIKKWWQSFKEWFAGLTGVEEEPVPSFTDGLPAKGYVYNDVRDWWERTWSTNEGQETILEVYKEEPTGEWKQLMIGYGDRVFYEEEVNDNGGG